MNIRKHSKLISVPVVLLIGVLGACGSDNNKGASTTTAAGGGTKKVVCATGSITGAGSTFVQTLAQQWIKDFEAACPGATVNYQGVGSGAGIEQFSAGTVDFAGSDAVMKPDEEAAAQAKGGAVAHIPWASGGIAVIYNVSGVTDLKLSPETIAGIFAGTIKKWNDPKIAADNSGASLPGTTIQVIHRSDGSGTTKVFTSYMTDVAPDVWKGGADKEVAWPTGQGAKGSDGVAAAVKQTDGAIGYDEVSFAELSGLSTAKVKNPSGAFVGPTADAVSAAIGAAEIPADLKVKVTYKPTDPGAYPISTTTWVIVHTKPADAAKAKLLKAFILYALGPGQDSSTKLSYAPLPEALVTKAEAATKQIQG